MTTWNMLIIGGTGIIGNALAKEASLGFEVYSIAKDRGLGVPNGVKFVKADRQDRKQFRFVLDELTKKVRKWKVVVDVCAYNRDQTSEVYRTLKGKVDHIFILSTTLTHDRYNPCHGLDHTFMQASPGIQGGYVDNKLGLERFWMDMSEKSEIKYTILKPYHIIGRGSLLGCIPRHNRDPLLVERIEREEPLELCDGGRILASFVHPLDIARVILEAAGKRRTYCNNYAVVHPVPVLAREYFEEIAEMLGKKIRVKDVTGQEIWRKPNGWALTTFPHEYKYEVSELSSDVGYEPRIPLSQCIYDALVYLKNPKTHIETDIRNIPVHINMNRPPAPKRHLYFT